MTRKTSLVVSFLFACAVALSLVMHSANAQVTPSKYNGTGVSPINARVLVFSTAKVITSANKYYFKSNNGSTHIARLDESAAGKISLWTITDDDLYLGSNSTDNIILSDTTPNIQMQFPNGNSMFFGDQSGTNRINLRNSSGWQIGTTDGTGYSFRVNTGTADSHLDITDRSMTMNAGTMSNSAKRGFLTSASGGAQGGFYIGGSGGTGDIAAGTISGSTFEIVTTDAVRVSMAPGDGAQVDHKDEAGHTLWSEIDDGTGGHFSMTGTTKSTNLNADLLDGIDSTGFLTALHGILSIYAGVAAPAGTTSTVWTTTWPTGAPVTALGTCSVDPITPGIGAGTCTYKLNDVTAGTSCTVSYVCGTGTVANQACTSGNAVSMTAGDTITMSTTAPAANTGTIGNMACNY